MKKMKKVQVAALALGLTAGLMGVAFINSPAQAAAEGEAFFAMKEGASVRLVKDEAGIRWATSVSEAWYANNIPTEATNVSFGTLVTSANNVSAVTNLTEDTAEVKDLPCKVEADFSDGDFTYYSSIVFNNMSDWTDAEIKAAYAAELIARSYVKYTLNNEVFYQYADVTDSVRCMRAIALVAYQDTENPLIKNDEIDEYDIVDDYFGEAATETVALPEYYEAIATQKVENYSTAYFGAKKVGVVDNGQLTLDGLALGANGSLTLFDDNGNYAQTSAFTYITAKVNKSNYATLLGENTTEERYYVLTEDLSGSTLASNRTFVGTLDGQGHKITGLLGTGMFKAVNNATFKNLIIEDVYASNQGGIIAQSASGNVNLENVYASFRSGIFSLPYEPSKYDEAYVEMNHRYKGLFSQYYDEMGVITVDNTVIYMPEFLSTAHGFLAGRSNAKAVVKNSTFIGGNGRVFGEGNKVELDENSFITDAVAAHQQYKANWTAQNKDEYNANHPYVEITQENFETVMPNLLFQVAVLTEDITISSAWNANANKARFFQGVFDGQNHKITGMNPTATGGLFVGVAGSVKNFALYGEFTKNYAFIAENLGNAGGNEGCAYVENVYIEVLKCTGTYQQVAPIAKQLGKGGASLKNVVINNKGNALVPAFFTAKENETAKLTAIASNCYVIFGDGDAYANGPMYKGDVNNGEAWTDHYFEGTTYFIDSDKTNGVTPKNMFDQAYTEGTVILTDFLASVIYPTN